MIPPPDAPTGSGSFSLPVRLALGYLAFGLLWLVLTDWILFIVRIQDPMGFWAALGKGAVFLGVSAAFLYGFARREIRQVARTSTLLHAVVESTTDAVFVKDRKGAYLLCNGAAARFMGRTPEEVIGRTDADLFDSTSCREIRDRDERVMQTGIAHTADETLTAAGVTRTYHAAKAPYRDADGTILGLVGISRDITHQVDLEAKLREQDVLLREAGELARIGGWAFDPLTLKGQWTEVTAQLFEEDFHTFNLDSTLRFFSGESRQRLDLALKDAIEHGTPYDLEVEFTTSSGKTRWARTLGRPIVENGKVILVRGSIQDITAQKQLQDELLRNETRVRALGDNIPDGGIYSYQTWPDGRSRYDFISRGIERMFGITAEQARTDAAALHDLVVPEDAERLAAAERRSLANMSAFECEFRSRMQTGNVRWIHCRAAPIRLSDGSTLWNGVAIDITERKRGELVTQAALAQAQRFRSALDHVPSFIYMKDARSRYVYANHSTLELFGCTAEALLGRSDEDFFPPETARRLQAIDARVYAGEKTTEEVAVEHPTGRRVYLEVKAPIYEDQAESELWGLVGISTDITAAVQAEHALRASEERFRGLVESIPALLWVNDGQGRPVLHNRRWYDYTGQTPEDTLADRWHLAIHPEDAPTVLERWNRSKSSGENYSCEYRLRGGDGTYRWFHSQGIPVHGPDGIEQWIGLCTDIEARVQAEHALQIRTNLYAMLSRTNLAVSRCRNADDLFREACAIAVETGRFRFAWMGVPDGKQVKRVASAGIDHGYLDRIVISLDEDDPRSQGPTGRAFLTGRSCMVNDFMATPITTPWHENARQVGFAASASFPVKERGEVVAALTVYAGESGFFTDDLVTTLGEIPAGLSFAMDAFAAERDRVRAENALRASEARFRAFMDNGPFVAWIADSDGTIDYASGPYQRIFDLPPGQVEGKRFADLFPPDLAQVYLDNNREVARTGRVLTTTETAILVGGFMAEFLVYKFPIPSPDRILIGGVAVDITERARLQADLMMRDRAIQAVKLGIVITDPALPDNPIIYVSPGFERMTGYTAEEVLGRNCRFLQGKDTDPAEQARLREAIRAETPFTCEILNYRKDGSSFWNELSIAPVRDSDGNLTHFVGIQTDVTDRRGLEDQLRQAQKMEAIGQLAGGVAHDFNNLLTIINGYSDLALAEVPTDPHLHELLSGIREAGERAATLTQRLLAFSRRAIVVPRVVDLNDIVDSISKMLRRLIGENISLDTLLAPSPCVVRIDTGQLEQVIMNLTVNARDAMPYGGRLTIETGTTEILHANQECNPGKYFYLAIADTGCGMTDDVKERIFEPFFTTKGLGKGTGLGLSMVYGIAKQAGGCVLVDSTPGKGTTFRILLPPVDRPENQRSTPNPIRLAPRGSETILLAEDEDAVRKLARLALEMQGYRVVEAASGEEALAVAKSHPDPIHLLVTDVVMPGMGGRNLVDAIRSVRPDILVIYVSGYTDDAILRHGVDVTSFLQKPFTPLTLARKVREVLDAKTK